MKSTYYSKEQIKRRVRDPKEAEVIWDQMMQERALTKIDLPIDDQYRRSFFYVDITEIREMIQKIIEIDQNLSIMQINVSTSLSMADESYYSSVLEGAYSTRKRAQEVIRTLDIQNRSEQMIVNNYHGLQFALTHGDDLWSREKFIELHKIITKNTLSKEDESVDFRTDHVRIADVQTNETVYHAPQAEFIEGMIENLILFTKGSTLSPLIVASIVHFYIGFVHPFFDGNGRTARAMMYGYLIAKGFPAFQNFSISSKYNFSKSAYYQAFIDTEKEMDLTYFILMNLRAILDSITDYQLKMVVYLRKVEIDQKIIENQLVVTKNQNKIIKIAVEQGEVRLSSKIQKWWESNEQMNTELTQLIKSGIFVQKKSHHYMLANDKSVDGATKGLDVQKLHDLLFGILDEEAPLLLDLEAHFVQVTDVESVEIHSVVPNRNRVQIGGTGTVFVTLQYGSDIDVRHDGIEMEHDYLFTFRLIVDDEGGVKDYEVDIF